MENFCTQDGLRWTPKLSKNHLNPNKVPTVVWNGPKHSKSLIMTYWNRHIESILGHKGLLWAYVSALTIWGPRLTIATIGNHWFIIYTQLLNPVSISTFLRFSICVCKNFLPCYFGFCHSTFFLPYLSLTILFFTPHLNFPPFLLHMRHLLA